MNIEATKIIKVIVKENSSRYAVSQPIYKEDYGLYLLIEGLELPEIYTVDFSASETASSSVSMLGNSDGVLIPQQFIKTGQDIFAFLYLTGNEFGRTVYKFKIPNRIRPDRTNDEPEPEEQSLIDQAISALNDAVEQTAQDVLDADTYAQRASEFAEDARNAEARAATSAATAQTYANNAGQSALASANSASASAQSAEEARQKAESITGLVAEAITLPEGSSATASYSDGTLTLGIPKGKDGTDGDDGYSPTADVSKTGKTATITITDKNGTTTAQVEDGEDGTDGIDGISPSVSVTDITGGHRVVITDKDGAKSFDVEDGATGATPNLTIGTVETLEPTDDATATITGTPENPVLNLGIPQGDAGEVTLADLNTALTDKAPIITDTASGSIASFTDGADDLPLKSLVVDINPVQDLHGQDAPYPAGGGKNVFPPPTSISPSGTTTITNNNGVLAISSTGAGQSNIHIPSFTFAESGQKIELLNSFTSAVIRFCYQGEQVDYFSLSSANRVIPEASITSLQGKTIDEYRIQLNGATSGTLAVMVTPSADSALSAFSPYENICPISGWTSVDVEHTGVNVWGGELEEGYVDPNSGEYRSNTSNVRAKTPFKVVPSATYFFCADGVTGSKRFGYCFYDNAQTYVSGSIVDVNNPITVPSNAHYMSFFLPKSWYTGQNISINYPNTDHDYHPYTGRSITINLGQTVYGGHLDVLSGVLTVDRAMVDLGTLTWEYAAGQYSRMQATLDGIKTVLTAQTIANAICSMYSIDSVSHIYAHSKDGTIGVHNTVQQIWAYDSRYSDVVAFKEAVTGQTLVYELATPITVQLTPNQVNSLLGVNNIWADSGDTTAEYRADTKAYIAKKIAEAISALS